MGFHMKLSPFTLIRAGCDPFDRDKCKEYYYHKPITQTSLYFLIALMYQYLVQGNQLNGVYKGHNTAYRITV